MSARRAPGLSPSLLCLALAALGGCAGPANSAGGQTSRETTPTQAADEAFVCTADDGWGAGETTGGVAAEREMHLESAPEAAPADVSDAPPERPRPSARRTAESQGVQADSAVVEIGALSQDQRNGLGALACALDAADCGSAAHLSERVCDLAERICALDASAPHCAEARSRCDRARARVRLACPAPDEASP